MILRNTDRLLQYTILTRDGEIGKVADFLFDDTTWTLRYLVIDTGHWLPGRKVLISPLSVQETREDAEQFVLNLTKEQVENSPNIHKNKPVSLQHQIDFHNYYSLHYYWNQEAFIPIYPPLIPELMRDKAAAAKEEKSKEDPHLRSVKEVMGYHIHAIDDEIGHVEDFLINKTWKIHYMIVDTRNWLPGGKKVLVSPEWIKAVSWEDEAVAVYLTKESVENSPEYTAYQPVSREYEHTLYEHYKMPKYWEDIGNAAQAYLFPHP